MKNRETKLIEVKFSVLNLLALQTKPENIPANCRSWWVGSWWATSSRLHCLQFCFDFWLTSLYMSEFSDRKVHFINSVWKELTISMKTCTCIHYCRGQGEGEMSKKALKKQQKEAEKAAKKAQKKQDKENQENVSAVLLPVYWMWVSLVQFSFVPRMFLYNSLISRWVVLPSLWVKLQIG